MSHATHLIAKPLFARVSVASLGRFLRLAGWLEKGLVISAVVTLLVVAAQMAYPANRALPLASVGGVSVSMSGNYAITQKLDNLNHQESRLQIGSKTYRVTPQETGILFDTKAAASAVTAYSWRERLTPFSLFSHHDVSRPRTVIDHAKLDGFAQKIIAENNKAAVNAVAVRQKDGSFKLKKASYGMTYDLHAVESALISHKSAGNKPLAISGQAVSPKITDEKILPAIQAAAARQHKPLKVSLNSKTYRVSSRTLAAWSQLKVNNKTGRVSLVYNDKAVKKWVDRSLPSLIKAPQTAKVTMLDGRQVSRTHAKAGQALDVPATTASITTALKTGKTSVKASTYSVAPRTQYVWKYTANGGLSALIAHWARSHPGMSTGVSLTEIGGQGRKAGYNSGGAFRMASLYKLYTAWYVYHGIETGKIKESTMIVNGKNARQCIQAMIIVSDNPCGEAFGNKYGWSNINNFARTGGFRSTAFDGLPTHTTSTDMNRYLLKLRSGQLMNPTHTSQLLGYMQHQIYRGAIPAGSRGAVVQDKVGFSGAVWDDSAIVTSGHSTYVLTVLTYGGGPAAIQDLAARIYAQMN